MRILVLDVEGTIITNYDLSKKVDKTHYPAIINSKLKKILKHVSKLGIKIVIATGTDGEENMEYYKGQFEAAGIAKFISFYKPPEDDKADSKADKLDKYFKYFSAQESEYPSLKKSDFYFFDDGKGNIDEAKERGFTHSYLVTEQSPLITILGFEFGFTSSSSSLFKKPNKLLSQVGQHFSKKKHPDVGTSGYHEGEEEFVYLGEKDKDDKKENSDESTHGELKKRRSIKPSAD